MVKQIIVHDRHTDYIKSIPEKSKCVAGLIIGKTSPSKDYIVRLIQCPAQITEGGCKSWNKIEDIDDSWVSGHAAQVIPSLPGGIEVIGVFLITNSGEQSKNSKVKLRQMLYQSYKLVSKTLQVFDNFFQDNLSKDEPLFWTVAHLDGKSGTPVNCHQYDVKDKKDTGRPVEWKQQDVCAQWDCLKSHVILEQSLVINSVDELKSEDILQQVVESYCKQIVNSYITIDGKHRSKDEVLNLSSGGHAGKSTKKKKIHIKSPVKKVYSCQIHIPLCDDESEKNISCEMGCGHNAHMITLHGNITGIAFVLPGTSVKEALHYLKRDIVQSIYQRCEITSEDLKQAEDNLCTSNSTVLPLRFFCLDPEKQGDRILFSDYQLPEEPVEDCLERIKDNLDLKLHNSESNVIEPREMFPTKKIKCSIPESIEVEDKTLESKPMKQKYVFGVVLAAAVAALGWVFSQMGLVES